MPDTILFQTCINAVRVFTGAQIILFLPASTSLVAFFWAASSSCNLAFSFFIWSSSCAFGILNWSCLAKYIFCLPYSLKEIWPLSANASRAFCTAVFFRLNFCNASAAFWTFKGLFCWKIKTTSDHYCQMILSTNDYLVVDFHFIFFSFFSSATIFVV